MFRSVGSVLAGMLDASHKRTLLTIARTSIESVLVRDAPEAPEVEDEVLVRPAACFVTLKRRDGELRGCIGTIRPVAPLHEAVAQSALSAAFRDPRFRPVTIAELPALHIEISVLGAIVSACPEEVVVGRDGLIITYRGRTGLLLPQVPTEYGWDREQFLDHTCVKAGVAAGAWRLPECRIERFPAEIFGESSF